MLATVPSAYLGKPVLVEVILGDEGTGRGHVYVLAVKASKGRRAAHV